MAALFPFKPMEGLVGEGIAPGRYETRDGRTIVITKTAPDIVWETWEGHFLGGSHARYWWGKDGRYYVEGASGKDLIRRLSEGEVSKRDAARL